MKYLVTGAAGFIGMYTAKRLLDMGHDVVGLDNLNSYYNPALKDYRLAQLTPYPNFRFVKLDLADRDGMANLFKTELFERVIHLAAQAGVRYSIEAPFDYIDSNLVGMTTILEGCRHNKVQHLVYASSSSVYGMNDKIPFSETDNVDQPVSLYAATKKANELMAHAYSKLYGIPTTGLRFFTVYGPAGRPDMAPWLFTEAILNNQPIKVFNHGKMQRDFTYIDDIVEGIVRIQDVIPATDIPYTLFNIGNNQPIVLSRFISAIESATGKQAEKISLGMQPGDVERTYADTDRLEVAVGYKPKMDIETGMKNFVEWYKTYHNL
ncbi:NAD-dependent epimerase [Stutzerimonas stutzeri]|uniref:NAD-dependent epimerase n=1 Tax=Stutzerimonas stutzeri TaxID=316 RepID=UPI000F77BA16|nr:NAD-dependent epimerase [Stutzerimonas stutzeri]RRV88253.1 NAD-dependent epimerase [Stutzerimonas stutzeri]RRV98265.1 NAD-dependent epimerase [Stutzerimonas stutzeri]RRW00032.1 NAD-dependent epimerase [Stutzerimonas stutzeri]RRW02653.1 NAD-dependent epimerase [Stutzerimonas stutzeri]